MKRVVLGVLVLAVCGMMIAPAAMAGKPGGGGSGSKYSTMTKDFVATNSIGKWTDGNTYPLVKLEISSGSHPFFTGKQKLLDTAGRVEKFNKKYSKKQ